MMGSDTNRVRDIRLRIALGVMLAAASGSAVFAQSEPPLDVPLAGAIPQSSSGCDAAQVSGQGLYAPLGQAAASPANTTSQSGANKSSAIGPAPDTPLYSPPNSGTNLPLFSNSLEGDNVPLYGGALLPGQNSPLFTTPVAIDTSRTFRDSQYSPASNLALAKCRSGIPVGSWLIYPSLRVYSNYSNNVFLAPSARLNAWAFGETPSVTAQWTNGIHTSTIFATVDTQQFPTDNPIDTFNRQVNWTQSYSPLPDVTFTGLADYTHQTIANALPSSIPSPVTAPVTTATALPNGDIQLPNGQIVTPNGQVVGNIYTGSSGAQNIVNPFDQYTTSFTATKTFNRAILSLSGSWAETDYQYLQNPGPSAFSAFATQTYRENSSVWLTPILYAYSDGAFSTRRNGEGVDPYSQVYRTEGGLGTTEFAGFRGSAYYGYQGSNADTGGAGGIVYGGKLSYFPSVLWTLTAGFDETINKASGIGVSTQALVVNSAEQIPLSSSTRITSSSFQSVYQIAPQWTTSSNLTYTQIDYYGSPRLDHVWDAAVQLNYDIWRNMTLGWNYDYTIIQSNAPGISANRNFLSMSAEYKF